MPDIGGRDARRTELFIDGLMESDERRSPETPTDLQLDPSVITAARQLRAGLVRVHPSFRFEEALSGRLADAALRMRNGLPGNGGTADKGVPGRLSPFPGAIRVPYLATKSPVPSVSLRIASRSAVADPVAALRRLPAVAAKQQRPLLVGGVGVASAALSIGAVYVAWRRAHPNIAPMVRAARAAHAGRANHNNPGRSRRSGILLGILGVMS